MSTANAGFPEFPNPRYVKLESILARAYLQATEGKGKERHAFGENYEDQKVCQINRWLRSPDGALYQAIKKAIESKRLPPERAVAELLGAINYLAAAVLLIEEFATEQPGPA